MSLEQTPIRFTERLIANLNKEMRKHRGRSHYKSQTPTSCLAIYGLCMAFLPDAVIDVGTAGGASCLSLALALHHQDKSLKALHTIGIQLSVWGNCLKYHRRLLVEYGMDIDKIHVVEGNFNDYGIFDFVEKPERVMIFYDIHDPPEDVPCRCGSETLLTKWIPHISDGLIVIHDVYDSDLVTPIIKDSIAKHWSGRTFAGYREVKPIIEWLNQNDGNLIWLWHEHCSMAFFAVRDGKPI